MRSSLEVVWEENSRPLSVEGLTTAEAASELAEEMGVGTSMKGMPPAKQNKRLERLCGEHVPSVVPGALFPRLQSLCMPVSKVVRGPLEGKQP